MPQPHSSNVPFDFDSLLRAARAGSMAAFGELLERFRKKLTAMAKRRLGRDLQSKESPRDAVQNALVEALEDFSTFRGTSQGVFECWLGAVLLNHIRDLRRAYRDVKKRQTSREISLESLLPADRQTACECMLPDAVEMLYQDEIEHVLHLCLATLSEAGRAIVRLHWMDGVPFEDIAVRLGMSADSARKRCARSLEAMAKLPFGRELFED